MSRVRDGGARLALAGACPQSDDMTFRVTVAEVEADLLRLLDDLAATGEEIEITRDGRTVAKIVRASRPTTLKGSLVGVAVSVADDEALFTTGALSTFR